MQVLDETPVLLPIGSFSKCYNGTLRDYSFSKAKNEYVRELSELPFALGAILHSNTTGENRASNTSFIGNLAERIIGEWLKKYAEYSFQPEAHYIYQTDSGRDRYIQARAHDYTLLDDGSIFNVEVKYIANGAAQRRSNRFKSGTEQLKFTSAILTQLSNTSDPDLPKLKSENIILVIRRESGACANQDIADKTISEPEKLYKKLLATARKSDDTAQFPRIILGYKDLTMIFKSLYPQHKPNQVFTINQQCITELISFSAKNT